MATAFLIVDGYDKVRTYTGSSVPSYQAIVDGQHMFSIETCIFLIDTKKHAFMGIAFPYEIHITKHGTVVFFTLANNDLSEKTCRRIYELAMEANSVSNGRPRPKAAQTYAESANMRTGTSTIDPAMAMSLGMDRSTEEIAERQQKHPERGYGISDILKSMGEDF